MNTMSNRLKKDPYADFRSHLVQKALEEKKRMEMEELKEVVYQNSSFQCCISDTATAKSDLGSTSRHSWKKISETSQIDQNQQSLCSLSKEFMPFSSIEKPTDETNVSHLQPSRIPSPPFLLDHIENEDEFLYGKCDSSPVYQTPTSTLLNSYNSCQSPHPKKTAGSSGWSDDDDYDFLPMQSDCLKPDFSYDPKNITRDIKFSSTTWKKYEQTESSVAGLSKVGLPFDVSEGNCPEFLKSKFGCNQELNKTQLHVSKSEKKKDYFGLIPSSVSAPKPSIPDIASLLKNLKQIQTLQNENVQTEALVHVEDLSDNLAPQTFTPVKNKIALNLKSKNPSSTNDDQVLQTQKDCINKSQVSNAIINQGAYSNQNTAALLVSQFLQKLSTKQGNRKVYQKVKCVTKPVSNTDRSCSDKNSYQSEPCEKEPSAYVFDIKKFEINSLPQSSLARSHKRSISSDSHILECPKKSKITESFPQKHCSQSDEQNSEASKHSKNSLKKEGINIKEGSICGILKVKAQDLGCDKNCSENSSDTNPTRFDRNTREKSYDRCSRRWSRSPRRRSPGESPRKRCRSHKRSSPHRSPKRRSRSCKRSHDRSPRKKFFGRSPRHQSCSRRHRSNDVSPEKRLRSRSPPKESHGSSPRRFLQNNTSVFSLGKNFEIGTEVNTVSKQLLPEDNSNRSPCSESFTVLDQKCHKSLHTPKDKKSVLGTDTPQVLNVPTPESIRLKGLVRRKDHSEGVKLDTRKKHSVITPVMSNEIEIQLDSLGSAEILPVHHDKRDSDDKSVVRSQFSKRKIVKKISKREPICTGFEALKPTDSVCSSSDDVTCSQHVQPELTQLAPSPALVTSDLYADYSGSSVENYQAAYQPSAYSEVVDPLTYSYYMNTLPYSSFSSYGTSSYNMYTSQYPMENHVQQRIAYSDYYTESPVPHKQIPVINPTAALEEKHISKKALPKKDRRKAVLIQVDSSACDASNKSEEKMKKNGKNESRTEKGDKSESETEKGDSSENKIDKRGKSKSEIIDGSGSKMENEKNCHERETKRDKNEDKIGMKGTTEGGTENRGKGKCKTEKEGKREDQNKDNDKAPSEVAETAEEKELLCRKIEIKKQIENLNSEYVRMSKLQGEMMRKMRREKDGHKDYIITAYGRLQDEIKVQLTDLMTAIRDIDKEMEKKIEPMKCSTPRTEGEFYQKSLMAEKIAKGRFVSTMVEVIPENPEFYDPGGHWCQNCNKLTTTVYDMLLHLKSEEHKEHMDPLDKPWFSKSLKKIKNRNEVNINKSYPVKGVHFVMPVDGFYCSLCKLTFPDSAIAEDHLVGNNHNAAYKKLIAENPVYERCRILDRLAGVAIIQKEENRRRLEAQKELANKRKKQEEEINKRKEASKRREEKHTSDKVYRKKKEENVDHMTSGKSNFETEGKRKIKLELLESKKSKCGDRTNDNTKHKQTVVYIGRAPNYKPRTHEIFTSKSCLGGVCNREIKKDIWLKKKSLISKPYGCNLNQKENKKHGSCNDDSSVCSSSEGNLFQKVLAKDKTFKKNLFVIKSHEVASNKKKTDDFDSCKSLNELYVKNRETMTEAMNVASGKQSDNFDGKMYSKCSSVLASTVLQCCKFSTSQTTGNSTARDICSDIVMTEDVSMTSKVDRVSECIMSSPKSIGIGDSSHDELSSSVKKLPPSSLVEQTGSMNFAKKNFHEKTLSREENETRRVIHFPLTEEETDLVLLGINKDDQLPLAVPKPPPSVIARSNIASGAEGTITQQDIQTKCTDTQAKCTNSEVRERTSILCKNRTLQKDNPSKSKDGNIFLEELARKAKEYAENSSTQSSLTYNQSLHHSLPCSPYQLFYYYPTTENSHIAQWVPTQPLSMSFSGTTYPASQANNSHSSSVVSNCPTISNCSETQAGALLSQSVNSLSTIEGACITEKSVSQDQISAYSPSFQITTATVQANALQKSNTATVQAIVSQRTSITSIEPNISQKPGISTVDSNILEISQNQNSVPSVSTQSCSVVQGNTLHLSNVGCVQTQTNFTVPSCVTYTTDVKSNLGTSASVLEKPCTMLPKIKNALKGHESASCPTDFSAVLACNETSIRTALQSSQESSEESNVPLKGSSNIDLQHVSLAPPGVNNTKENVSAIQQKSIPQQKVTPASTIPASFSAVLPSGADPDIQTSPEKQENITHQLVTGSSANNTTKTILSVSNPISADVDCSHNYKFSSMHGNISETNTDSHDIQNCSPIQGKITFPLVANCVSASQHSSGASGNISQTLPVAVQTDNSHFPLSFTSAHGNLIASENVLQPQQNFNYVRQCAPVIQGNVSQQPALNCNIDIPDIPLQAKESIQCQLLVHYPPNFRGNSAVVANISYPPPNVRPYRSQYVPTFAGNIPQQSPNADLNGSRRRVPSVLGNVSQPPPKVNHSQTQLIQIVPGDVSKPSPHGSHSRNICVPPVPETVSRSLLNVNHSGNQHSSIILSNVSHSPYNLYLPRNFQISPVLGNILHSPPKISCTGTPHAPPVFASASQPPPDIDYGRNWHSPAGRNNITHSQLRMNHCGPGIQGNMPHPPDLQNAIRGQITLHPHVSNCVHITEALNVPVQPHGFPRLNTVSNCFQNYSVNKNQIYPTGSCNDKPVDVSLHADVSLLSTSNMEIKSISQENIQPPCMPFSPATHNNHLDLKNSPQKTSVGDNLLSQCDTLMKMVLTSVSSTSDSKNYSSPRNTTDHISGKINSQIEVKSTCPSVAVEKNQPGSLICGSVALQNSLKHPDVQGSEQVAPVPSVPHIQDKVNVSSASVILSPEEKSMKYEYSLCGTINPVPPGTEPIENLQPSHVSCQLKSCWGLDESVTQEPFNCKSPESMNEKVELNMESGAEMNVANELANSDYVESLDETVQQCLDVLITSVCSGQLGGFSEGIKSQEICCEPKLQKMHSDRKNDTVIDLNVDKAVEEKQSVNVTSTALSSHEFSEKKHTNFHETFHDVLNNSVPANDRVTVQKEKVAQLPSTFMKNKSQRSELENITEEKENCFHTQSREVKQFVNTVLIAQDSDLIHPGQNFNFHSLPLFKVPHPFQQHDSGSISTPITLSLHKGSSRFVSLAETPVSLDPAPPGTDPVTDIELPNSSHQLNIKFSQTGNQNILANEISEALFKKVESYQEHVEPTKDSATSTSLVQLQNVCTGKSTALCVSSSSNSIEMYNKDHKPQEMCNDCKAGCSVTCHTEHLGSKSLEQNFDKTDKVGQSATVNSGTHNMQCSLSDGVCMDSSVTVHDLENDVCSQNSGYPGNLKEPESNSPFDKMCSVLQKNVGIVSGHSINCFHTAQTNLQFSQCNNQGPLFQVNVTNASVASSETSKWHALYKSDNFNPPPPGTDPINALQSPRRASYEIQKPTVEFAVNARQENVSTQFPKYTYGKIEQSLEIDTQITVTKESNVSSNICSIVKQADIKDALPIKSSDNYPYHAGKKYSVQELFNQETQSVSEKTNEEMGSGNIAINSSEISCFHRLKCKDHVNDLEVCHVSKYYNKNTVNQSSEVVKSKCQILDPENVSGKQNIHGSDVQSSIENHRQYPLACSSIHNSMNNATVPSTQSGIIHNFSPWIRSSSQGMHSFSPHLAISSTFHQSFPKCELVPQCSNFFNPVPPGTEPAIDFESIQNSTLVHSQGSLSNKFDEVTNKKMVQCLEDVHIPKKIIKESDISTCSSRQSEDNFLNNSVAPVSANDVSPDQSNVSAKGSGAQELCSYSDNVMEALYPPDYSRKPGISTSEKTDKNEMLVFTSGSQETFKGMGVSSQSSTIVGAKT